MTAGNPDVPALLEAIATELPGGGHRLALAESCTGGLVSGWCTERAGSSLWFEAGWVTYSNASKTRLLGVQATLIDTFGAVSEAVACAMAEGALAQSDASVSAAITGVAGPGGGSAHKPVGSVWIAWAGAGEPTCAQLYRFDGDRPSVREQAGYEALVGVLARVQRAS